ncbi:hypothetical protein JCM10212_000089 [Sporobolomyces blumeae]
MTEAVNSMFGTVANITSSIPQTLSSLNELVAAEEEDSKRVRPSATDWWIDTLRFRGSTIPRVWRAVTICTLWAVLVAVLDLVYGEDLGLTNQITPMLSIVVGLILVFRNSSAYNRWDTGRQAFGKMTATVRSLSRLVWINVGAPTAEKSRLNKDGSVEDLSAREMGERSRDIEDKKKALRLMVAFVVATKHHLRGEYGTDWPGEIDLEVILPPRFRQFAYKAEAEQADPHHPGAISTPMEASESVGSEYTRLMHRNPSDNASTFSTNEADPEGGNPRSAERKPLLGKRGSSKARGRGGITKRRETLRSTVDGTEQVVMSSYLSKPSLPLPLVIAHQLSLYFASCKRRNQIESIGPAGYNALRQSLDTLVESFTQCERLVTVEIPNVYTIHLKQVVTIFLFTLPPVLVDQMGFLMIPFVTLAAFMLIGVEGISSAMEMPFGVDDSDLNLDLFCAELRNEVEHTIARLPRGSEEWCM